MGLGGLLRLAVIVFLAWLLYRGLRSLLGGPAPRRGMGTSSEARVIDELVEDPNCGTWLPRTQAFSARVRGRQMFFCSRECYEQYIKRLKQEDGQ